MTGGAQEVGHGLATSIVIIEREPPLMIATLRKRIEREDEGFTLIELMVVVLIIAILLAIAIPTFLGAQDRARDRGAQSDLRNSLTAAKTIATDTDGIFSSVTFTSLNTTEPSLNHTATALTSSSVSKDVLVIKGSGDLPGTEASTASGKVLLVSRSASGKFFGICADYKGAVKYMPGTDTQPTDFSTCTADKF